MVWPLLPGAAGHPAPAQRMAQWGGVRASTDARHIDNWALHSGTCKLARKQRPGQKPGAGSRREPHSAPQASDRHGSGGPRKAHKGLQHGRHLGHRGFHQHLLESPEHAAREQQRDGEGVDMGFAGRQGHRSILKGKPCASDRLCAVTFWPCAAPRRRQATPSVGSWSYSGCAFGGRCQAGDLVSVWLSGTHQLCTPLRRKPLPLPFKDPT